MVPGPREGIDEGEVVLRHAWDFGALLALSVQCTGTREARRPAMSRAVPTTDSSTPNASSVALLKA